MSFTRMELYSENNLPTCGTATSKTLCKNIANYKPYDVSSIGGISSYYDGVSDKVLENDKNIKELVSDLDEAWGVKFISFNDNSLNFVLPDKFEEDLNLISDDCDEQVKRCQKIIKDICDRLEKVKSYVKQLEDNLSEYNSLCSQRNSIYSTLSSYRSQLSAENGKENPNSGVVDDLTSKIGDCNSRLSNLSESISEYESYIIDEPEGQWIVE